MEIIAGTTSQGLAARIARIARLPLIRTIARTFPDGEEYLRLSRPIKGKSVAIVQTLYPSNRALVEFAFLADLAREQGARKIIAVSPYIAYSRQHMHYLPNDEISVRAVAKIMGLFSERLITFDLHNKKISGFFGMPVLHLTAARLLGEYGRRLRLKRPFVLGADQERPEFVSAAAKVMGAEHDILEKFRSRRTGKIRTRGSPRVRGKDVLIVDDIISTGHSIAEAAKLARRVGARSVHAACTHAILAEGAIRLMHDAGTRSIAATDSISTAISKISLAPAIAAELKKA